LVLNVLNLGFNQKLLQPSYTITLYDGAEVDVVLKADANLKNNTLSSQS